MREQSSSALSEAFAKSRYVMLGNAVTEACHKWRSAKWDQFISRRKRFLVYPYWARALRSGRRNGSVGLLDEPWGLIVRKSSWSGVSSREPVLRRA